MLNRRNCELVMKPKLLYVHDGAHNFFRFDMVIPVAPPPTHPFLNFFSTDLLQFSSITLSARYMHACHLQVRTFTTDLVDWVFRIS